MENPAYIPSTPPPPYFVAQYEHRLEAVRFHAAGFYPPPPPSSVPIHSPLGPLDSLAQILSHSEQLSFIQTANPTGVTVRTLVVRMTDSNGRHILSVVHNPPVQLGRGQHNMVLYTLSTTNFADGMGRIIMRATEKPTGIIVSSGDIFLGSIAGWSAFGSIKASNGIGEKFLRLEKETMTNGGGIVHKIVHVENGIELARLTRKGQLLTLNIPRTMDARTKGIVLATAYFVYLKHHARTRLGVGGANGRMKKMCLLTGICTVISIIVPLVLFLYLWNY